MTKIITIKGDYTINGYLSSDDPRYLSVALIEGVAHDADLVGIIPGSHRHEASLRIDADGALCAWGAGIAFLPDAGEIERVGRQHFLSC